MRNLHVGICVCHDGVSVGINNLPIDLPRGMIALLFEDRARASPGQVSVASTRDGRRENWTTIFGSRYALCSCKSISTEISARNNTAVQKNIAAPRPTLIQRLTHSMRKSRSATSPPFCSRQALSAAFAFDFQQATRLPLQSHLHRDRRFDRRMLIVTNELEIFELKVVNVFLTAGFSFIRGNGRNSRESCSCAWSRWFL